MVGLFVCLVGLFGWFVRRLNMSKPTWKKVLDEWQKGNYPKFGINFAFRWRCAPVNQAETWFFDSQVEPAELAKLQNPESFATFLDKQTTPVSFWNLGRTCLLVCPPITAKKNFAHLQLFDKNADHKTKQAFWAKVASTVRYARHTLKYPKVYVSTEGSGVDYLHVRISPTPKYYNKSGMIYPCLAKT